MQIMSKSCSPKNASSGIGGDLDADTTPILTETTMSSNNEIMAMALQKKTEGNAHFSNQHFLLARNSYQDALLALEQQPASTTVAAAAAAAELITPESIISQQPSSEQAGAMLHSGDGRQHRQQHQNGSTNTGHSSSSKDMQISLRSNLAQSCLKLQQFELAEQQCTIVLERWDASVAKVWYRRALAREHLASKALLLVSAGVIASAHEKVSPAGGLCETSSADTFSNSKNPGQVGIVAQSPPALSVAAVEESSTLLLSPIKYMELALGDLKHCVRLLQTQQHQNVQMKKSALQALDRVWKRLETLDKPKTTKNNNNNNRESDTKKHADISATHNARSQSTAANVKMAENKIRPSPTQQRREVTKLLVARSVSLQDTTTVNGNPLGGNGEALFLLDWSWWCQWCWHVDLFRTAYGASEPKTNAKSEYILKNLPPGAILPYRKINYSSVTTSEDMNKGTFEDDDQSSTTSGDSEGNNFFDIHHHDPPGPLDNSSLFLVTFGSAVRSGCVNSLDNGSKASQNYGRQDTTKARFYRHWYRRFRSTDEDGDDDEGIAPIKNSNDANNTRSQDFVLGGCFSTRIPLRPNLVRGFHYELLPREIYCALKSWYKEITPSICRRITLTNISSVNSSINGNQKEVVSSIQLHSLESSPKRTSSSVIATTSSEARCGACRASLATKRCTRCMHAWYCDRSCQESHWPFHKRICSQIAPRKADASVVANSLDIFYSNGFCGLNNMGNTCFINAALQCLSHATPLTRYFLSNQFKADINTSNPLGAGGKLAFAFDSVLKDLWLKPNIRSTSPTALKRAIALFAPRFAGCLQHDSQEFLAYILDGLHSDLNRIRRPPYVEMPDADKHGSNTAVAGAEAWETFMRRNDSLVVDSFYGQFKSTCVCPNVDCGRVSASFDAFSVVSLEIAQPRISQLWFSVILFANSNDKLHSAVRHAVCVRRGSLIVDIRQALSEVCGVPAHHLVLCEVVESTIVEILHDNKPAATIRSNETITAYQIEPVTTSSIHIICRHALLSSATKIDGSEEQSPSSIRELFGFPFMTSCDANFTCRGLFNLIWQRVRPVVMDVYDPLLEKAYQQLLAMRATDGDGNSTFLFPSERGPRNDMVEAEECKRPPLSCYVPRELDEKISAFLGENCTSRFLFFSLDWLETLVISPENSSNNAKTNETRKQGSKTKVSPTIQKERFLAFVDHRSFVEGLGKQRKAESQRGVTLDRCFETFTMPERLDEQNKWFCSNCKQHVRALKTMELWRLPNILIVHLKRFEFRYGYSKDKLATFVDFALEGLDMGQHCSEPPHTGNRLYVDSGVPALYDLFAVINHYGRMGFGHYTAFARKWDEGELSSDWSLFDDSGVQDIGNGRRGRDSVVSPAAYVLFYRRRTFY